MHSQPYVRAGCVGLYSNQWRHVYEEPTKHGSSTPVSHTVVETKQFMKRFLTIACVPLSRVSFVIQDKLYRVKHRLERLYGMDWNIYRAEGVLYSFIQSKPGSHLCFVHNGVTYGVFQTPTSNTKSSDH